MNRTKYRGCTQLPRTTESQFLLSTLKIHKVRIEEKELIDRLKTNLVFQLQLSVNKLYNLISSIPFKQDIFVHKAIRLYAKENLRG